MIISRTPLRMSFVGGGSDIPSFYKMHGGAVVSTSINKYIYINVNAKFDSGIRIAYSKTEEVSNIEEIEHKLVKASLQHLGIMGGIEITSIADIPSQGTGMGSSSSFTVGLLHALHAFQFMIELWKEQKPPLSSAIVLPDTQWAQNSVRR